MERLLTEEEKRRLQASRPSGGAFQVKEEGGREEGREGGRTGIRERISRRRGRREGG
jgi:hypothetical protein